jgi:hypothetical protein
LFELWIECSDFVRTSLTAALSVLGSVEAGRSARSEGVIAAAALLSVLACAPLDGETRIEGNKPAALGGVD